MDAPFRIATWNAISAKGLRRFPAHAYRVEHALADPDAILLRSHVLEAAAVAASVKAIARSGAGVNNVPVAEMSRRGIPVFNAPGANANAVKELVMAAILLAARNLVPAIDARARPRAGAGLRAGAWRRARRPSPASRCAARRSAWWGWAPSAGWSRTPRCSWGCAWWATTPRSPPRRWRGCPRRCGSWHRSTSASHASDFVTLHVPAARVDAPPRRRAAPRARARPAPCSSTSRARPSSTRRRWSPRSPRGTSRPTSATFPARASRAGRASWRCRTWAPRRRRPRRRARRW